MLNIFLSVVFPFSHISYLMDIFDSINLNNDE